MSLPIRIFITLLSASGRDWQHRLITRGSPSIPQLPLHLVSCVTNSGQRTVDENDTQPLQTEVSSRHALLSLCQPAEARRWQSLKTDTVQPPERAPGGQPLQEGLLKRVAWLHGEWEITLTVEATVSFVIICKQVSHLTNTYWSWSIWTTYNNEQNIPRTCSQGACSYVWGTDFTHISLDVSKA